MEFIWNEEKRRTNRLKHGVDFADAVAVFFDDMALTFPDPDHHDEQRFITIGMDASLHVLLVVYAYRREHVIRIISARKADKKERRQYEGIPI